VIKETRLSIAMGRSVERFHAEILQPVNWSGRRRVVPERSKLTKCTKSATFADVDEDPDPSIAASSSITRL